VVYGGILSIDGSFTNRTTVLCAAPPEPESTSVPAAGFSSCTVTTSRSPIPVARSDSTGLDCNSAARRDSAFPPSVPLEDTSAAAATSNSAQVCLCSVFLFTSTFSLMYARRSDWIWRTNCISFPWIATKEAAAAASLPIP